MTGAAGSPHPHSPAGGAGSKLRVAASLLVGVLLVLALVAWQGVAPIAEALASVGWPVLALPAIVVLTFLPLSTLSWAAWFEKSDRPGLLGLHGANWIGHAINWLLPVAQIGGDVVRVRLVARAGGDGVTTTATVVADKTGQVAAQVLATALGLALLLVRGPSPPVLLAAGGGLVLLSFLLVLFVRAQRKGIFGFAARFGSRLRISSERMGELAGSADASLSTLYSDPRRVVWALAYRLVARAALVLELWVALRLLGVDASIADAAILDSLTQAVRAVAFLIPAGLGVQEWGFALLAIELGISSPVGVALSLVRRVRELVVGVPMLLVWVALEARDPSTNPPDPVRL